MLSFIPCSKSTFFLHADKYWPHKKYEYDLRKPNFFCRMYQPESDCRPNKYYTICISYKAKNGP